MGQLMALSTFLWAFPLAAQTFEVKGEGVRFQPEIIHAAPGDVISFRKMIPHAVESLDTMWPAGAKTVRSELGVDFDYTITEKGVYLFRCPHHWGARMVGALIVGGSEDVRKTIASYLRLVDTNIALKPAKRLLKRLAMQQLVGTMDWEAGGH